MAEIYDAPIPWSGMVDKELVLFRTEVREDWIDVFGHVNTAHYLTIGDHANWAFWNWINGPEGTIEDRNGHEYVIVQNSVSYLDEIALGMSIHVSTQLLDVDEKRYILFHRIWKSDGNVLAATNEVKCLGFNLEERRSERWRPIVAQRLDQIREVQASLEVPKEAGVGITLKRK